MSSGGILRETVHRRRATVVWFLAITFIWAWVLWGYWVVAMPPGGLQISSVFIICAIAGGMAPTLAAIVMIANEGSMARVRRLATTLLPWRLDGTTLTVTVLLVPVSTVASVVIQALFVGPLHWPEPSLLAMAAACPFLAALGEELGWRGFLLPHLARRFQLLPAALMVGVIWGLWHLPADYIALKGYGAWFWLAFLLNGPFVLTAHSIIMAWLWRRTSGGLFTAVLYHATITASAIVTPTAGSEGSTGVLSAASGAVVIWVAALILLLARRNEFQIAQNAPDAGSRY